MYRSLSAAIRLSRCVKHDEADLAVQSFQQRLLRYEIISPPLAATPLRAQVLK